MLFLYLSEMNKVFSNWQFFFIGLLAGVIGGGAIVWLEMKDENRNFLSQILYELNTLKLEKKIAESEQEKEKLSDGKTKKSGSKFLKSSTKEKGDLNNPPPVSGKDSSVGFDSSGIFLTLTPPDSLFPDSDLASNEHIIVRKDRLVFFTTLKLRILDVEVPESDGNDSLLEEISGVKGEEVKEYVVEFWESPINYKGYKMGNKKIILFGLGDVYDNLDLFQVDKKLYFKNNEGLFQLSETFNFEPFKKISDKSLLSRLEGSKK